MNKDEIIALLQQQNSFLQEQLQEANRKADALLEEISSLRNLLEHIRVLVADICTCKYSKRIRDATLHTFIYHYIFAAKSKSLII